MPGRGRPFQKGNKASPGRPPGLKEVMPRNLMRRLAFAAVRGNEDTVRDALMRALTNPRTVLILLDLAAKLDRETGSRRGRRTGSAIVNLITNVDSRPPPVPGGRIQ